LLQTHGCQGKAQLEFREFSNESNFYEHSELAMKKDYRYLVKNLFFL